MPKTLTEDEQRKVRCLEVLNQWNRERQREWYIWASAHRPCPECDAQPRQACVNLIDLNQKALRRDQCRVNKNPHDSRLSWRRMEMGLRKRGYFRR